MNKRIADAEAKADMYKGQVDTLQAKLDEFEGDEDKTLATATQKMKKSVYDDIGSAANNRFVEADDGDIKAILQPEAMRAFMEDDSKYMMLDAPHAVEDWNGMSWSRDLGGDDSEMAVVYNNQVAATDKTFNKVYPLSAVESVAGAVCDGSVHPETGG